MCKGIHQNWNISKVFKAYDICAYVRQSLRERVQHRDLLRPTFCGDVMLGFNAFGEDHEGTSAWRHASAMQAGSSHFYIQKVNLDVGSFATSADVLDSF